MSQREGEPLTIAMRPMGVMMGRPSRISTASPRLAARSPVCPRAADPHLAHQAPSTSPTGYDQGLDRSRSLRATRRAARSPPAYDSRLPPKFVELCRTPIAVLNCENNMAWKTLCPAAIRTERRGPKLRRPAEDIPYKPSQFAPVSRRRTASAVSAGCPRLATWRHNAR